MTSDLCLAQIISLADDYDHALLRLGQLIEDKASEQARGPSYRALSDLADQLAAALRERGQHYRRQAQSWQEDLDRLHRHADD